MCDPMSSRLCSSVECLEARIAPAGIVSVRYDGRGNMGTLVVSNVP